VRAASRKRILRVQKRTESRGALLDTDDTKTMGKQHRNDTEGM